VVILVVEKKKLNSENSRENVNNKKKIQKFEIKNLKEKKFFMSESLKVIITTSGYPSGYP
jgi:hypothetical protein